MCPCILVCLRNSLWDMQLHPLPHEVEFIPLFPDYGMSL